jgi:enamine deaminase RidA (YjgF/YER057c/UK114 family)
LLKAAGMTFDNVVSARVPARRSIVRAMNAIYPACCRGSPARATVVADWPAVNTSSR